MITARVRIAGAVLAATLGGALLAGCDKKPEGQVVATVNGEEVTRRDLLSEVNALNNGNVSEEQMKAAQPMLVQGIVDRKLLVQEAKRSNLDKNPQYLALRQRTDDILLAQMLSQSWMGKIAQPNAAAIRAFIADNPLMFGERKLVMVDAIITPAASITARQLLPLNTNDAIVAWLKQRKKPFQRGNRQIDTMALPKPFAQQLVAQAATGQPVALNDGNTITIMAPRAVQPSPVPQPQWERVATQAVRQQTQNKTANDEIKRLRETADISYLPEYAPRAPAGNQATGQPNAK